MYKANVTLATAWGTFPRGSLITGVPADVLEKWAAVGAATFDGKVETAEAATVEQAVSPRGRRKK